MGASKLTKKQHYVPQFYLRNFANNNKLHRFDKEYSNFSYKSVEYSAYGDFYYERIGEKTNKIEDMLSKCETSFSNVFSDILAQCDSTGSFLLNEDYVKHLFMFWIIQVIRTPLAKDEFFKIFGNTFTDDLKQNLYCDEFCNNILRMHSDFTNKFVIKDVEIFSSASEFWTSDAPCYSIIEKEIPFFLVNQCKLVFPLSYKYYVQIIMHERTCCLERLYPVKISNNVLKMSEEDTNSVNQNLLSHYVQYIYKKNDFTAQEKSIIKSKSLQ